MIQINLHIYLIYGKNNQTKLSEILDSELKYKKRYIFVDTFPFNTTNIIEAISIFVILYCALVFNENVDLGSIYLVIYYIKHSKKPFNAIFNRIEECGTCLNSYRRIRTILDITQKEDIEKGENIKISGNIEFENVSMTYDENKVLENISFKIKQGQKVTIVGKTGVGKTTLVNLLMKLYDNYTGNILIDGKDIRQLSTKSIRAQVSYISQKPHILKDTLRNNIIINNTKIKDEQIIEVFNDIGAKNILDKIGLDDEIDSRKVSYGELQIIAFVRAILRNTNVYIFDEPTSNIDLKSEKLIQNLIDKIAKTSTVIVIAHRKSTIESSDKVIYLKDGKVDKIDNKIS